MRGWEAVATYITTLIRPNWVGDYCKDEAVRGVEHYVGKTSRVYVCSEFLFLVKGVQRYDCMQLALVQTATLFDRLERSKVTRVLYASVHSM